MLSVDYLNYFIIRCLIVDGMFGAVLYFRLFEVPVLISIPLATILDR